MSVSVYNFFKKNHKEYISELEKQCQKALYASIGPMENIRDWMKQGSQNCTRFSVINASVIESWSPIILKNLDSSLNIKNQNKTGFDWLVEPLNEKWELKTARQSITAESFTFQGGTNTVGKVENNILIGLTFDENISLKDKISKNFIKGYFIAVIYDFDLNDFWVGSVKKNGDCSRTILCIPTEKYSEKLKSSVIYGEVLTKTKIRQQDSRIIRFATKPRG